MKTIGASDSASGSYARNGTSHPPKKSVTPMRRDDEHVRELGEEQEAEAHAAVLVGETGDELGLGLGHVERRLLRVGLRRDREQTNRRTGSTNMRDEPNHTSCCASTMPVEVQRPGHHDRAEHREQQRDLVGDLLAGGAHAAHERPLGVATPSPP